MQITLKRALKLRKELEAHLAKFTLPATARLSLLVEENLKNPAPTIDQGTAALQIYVAEYDGLSDILRDVRTRIAEKNVSSGADVEFKLSAIADIDRQIAIRRKLIAYSITPSAEELKGEMSLAAKRLESASDGAYHARAQTAMEVSVVTAGMIERANKEISNLKSLKEKHEDERAVANGINKIVITEDQVNLLRKYSLI